MLLALGWTWNKWKWNISTRVERWLWVCTEKSSSSQEELKAQVVSFWKFLKGPVVSKSLWAMFSSWIPYTFCFSSWCSFECRACAQGCEESGCSEDLGARIAVICRRLLFKCSLGVGCSVPLPWREQCGHSGLWAASDSFLQALGLWPLWP